MAMRIVVSDTSCMINLRKGGLIGPHYIGHPTALCEIPEVIQRGFSNAVSKGFNSHIQADSVPDKSFLIGIVH